MKGGHQQLVLYLVKSAKGAPPTIALSQQYGTRWWTQLNAIGVHCSIPEVSKVMHGTCPTIYPSRGAVAMFGISASQLVHLNLTT